jgi:hypothetical protein
MEGAAIFGFDPSLLYAGFLDFELGQSRFRRADDKAPRSQRGGNRSRQNQALRKAQSVQIVSQVPSPDLSLAKPPILLSAENSKSFMGTLGKKDAWIPSSGAGAMPA